MKSKTAESEIGQKLEGLMNQYQSLETELIGYFEQREFCWREGSKVAETKDNFYGVVKELNEKGIDIQIPKNIEELEKKIKEMISFPNLPTESFLFSYDGDHEDFFQELITKANSVYSGTGAEIPVGTSGEIQGHLIKRMGLISTIANDSSLRNAGLHPITATQSEYLLQAKKLTSPRVNWEDFGMVLYDRSSRGYNQKEAKALYNSLKAHRIDLSLSESDLENRLIIINPGAEVDSNMPHGVKPIIIPGITQVYQHEVLEKVGKDLSFDGWGLGGGLPLLNQLEGGSRALYMLDETFDMGLRVLCRDWNLSLDVGYADLANSGSSGRINFARSALPY